MLTAKEMKGTKIEIRKATKVDLPFIMETERKPDNFSCVLQWSEETHLNSIADSNLKYFIFEEINTKKPIGFCILRGLDDSSRNIELKRIAVNEKGKGFGREALKLMKKDCI